jgi:hypothetical protein
MRRRPRAIDRDPSDPADFIRARGTSCRRRDAVYMAATDRNAGPEQSSCQGGHPYMVRGQWRVRAEDRPGETPEGAGKGERAAAQSRLRSHARETDPPGGRLGHRRSAPAELLSPARRRHRIDHVRKKFAVSERFACRVLGQHRSTQRKVPRGRPGEDELTADIVALASQYGRYGYRRIAALLRDAGWAVNVKRVERIWRRD